MQDELEDLRDCGIGGFRPKFLQGLANIKVSGESREKQPQQESGGRDEKTFFGHPLKPYSAVSSLVASSTSNFPVWLGEVGAGVGFLLEEKGFGYKKARHKRKRGEEENLMRQLGKVVKSRSWQKRSLLRKSLTHFPCNSQVFVLLLSILVTLQQALSSGYLNSVITTIEKRYEIPSSITGIVASMYEIGNMGSVIFVSYLGSKRNIPTWIGLGE